MKKNQPHENNMLFSKEEVHNAKFHDTEGKKFYKTLEDCLNEDGYEFTPPQPLDSSSTLSTKSSVTFEW